MKKILIAILVISMGVFFSCKKEKVSKEDDAQIRYITAKGGLRMRGKPTLKGKKIGLIPEGTKVQLLDEKGKKIKLAGTTGKWSKVKWNDKTGWAFGGFLSDKKVLTFPIKIKMYGCKLKLMKNGSVLLNGKSKSIHVGSQCENNFLRGKWSRENNGKLKINYIYNHHDDTCPDGLLGKDQKGSSVYDPEKGKIL